MAPSTEEVADLKGFTPARAHLSLREVYGDFSHQNNGTHLAGGVPDDAMWKSLWRQPAAQSARWYSTPPGKVGRRFTTVLVAEWRGAIDQKWNYKRSLVFAHVVLIKTLGACKARETRARPNRRLDLWETGIRAGLVGVDAAVE